MDENRWGRINEIFHRVIDEPIERRDAVLDEATAGDIALRAEVASLLAWHGKASDFIEKPAEEAVALFGVALPDLALPVPQDVGHYRVTRVLGEGGMGVVYLAEDTKLGRLVALKALAPRFVGDETRRERLRREARAAAPLTHPGIATIYALEEFGDHLYIAAEYVPGETLRTELSRGPLPAIRAIETALGIARALAAAHDRGVIHRDLKPENVIRTPAGDVKILDFGLARLRDAPHPLAALTDDAAVIGTPAYMSPEQIRGERVDLRSDLFSLGTMIYELASGLHPFAGSSPASTIARILEAEPPRLTGLAMAGGPGSRELAELDLIAATCLKKSVGERYGSAHELVAALEHARDILSGRTSDVAPARRRLEATSDRDARWWWQFHQAATSVAYYALLVPLWFVHRAVPGRPALLVFLAGLVAAAIASTLRLHLWFTVRSYPAEFSTQRRQTFRWLMSGDGLFVAVLVSSASLVLDARVELAVLLVAAAVAVLLSFTVIEPATTRAAFGPSSSD